MQSITIFHIVLAAQVFIAMVWLGISRHRHYMLCLLFIMMLLGPRISLGMLRGYQRLDIRPDDFVIFSMFLSALVMLVSGKVSFVYPKYMLYLFLFMISSMVSSIYASLRFDFNFFVSMLFFTRLFEYTVLAFIVPFFITDMKDFRDIFLSYAASIGLNIVWLMVQIFTGVKGPFYNFAGTTYYGFAMLSTTLPYSVGSVFTFSLIIFSTYFLYMKRNPVTILFVLGSIAGIIMTLSRTSIVAMLVTLAVISFFIFRIKKLKPSTIFSYGAMLIVILAIINIVFDYMSSYDVPAFRLNFELGKRSLEEVRLEQIWIPVYSAFRISPILGYGTGNIKEILTIRDEAHNYYLRLLAESGLVGFSLYMIFMVKVALSGINLIFSDTLKTFRYIALIFVIWIISVSTMSIAQDAIQSPETAIQLFTLIGLINYIQTRVKVVLVDNSNMPMNGNRTSNGPLYARERSQGNGRLRKTGN